MLFSKQTIYIILETHSSKTLIKILTAFKDNTATSPNYLRGGSLESSRTFRSRTVLERIPLLRAAAGDEKERDDKDPDPVIVEDTAKTVVIHKISSLK